MRTLDNCRRADIRPGMLVDIVLKKDQPTGKLTRGRVGRLLTNKAYHPRGVKVMLDDGQVGRVQRFVYLESNGVGFNVGSNNDTAAASTEPEIDTLI